MIKIEMKKFIGEEISILLQNGEILEKTPKCPVAFIWQDQTIQIQELLSAWTDFSRKGESARNMREEHLRRAQVKGSWGVGRFYFKVRDGNEQIFTIYYDRAPANASSRKGKWILFTKE